MTLKFQANAVLAAAAIVPPPLPKFGSIDPLMEGACHMPKPGEASAPPPPAGAGIDPHEKLGKELFGELK